MTVLELVAFLSAYPGSQRVIIARDEEGNGFGTNIDVTESNIEMGEGKHGYIDSTIHEDDLADYEDRDLERVVVIWP